MRRLHTLRNMRIFYLLRFWAKSKYFCVDRFKTFRRIWLIMMSNDHRLFFLFSKKLFTTNLICFFHFAFQLELNFFLLSFRFKNSSHTKHTLIASKSNIFVLTNEFVSKSYFDSKVFALFSIRIETMKTNQHILKVKIRRFQKNENVVEKI